ncbi:hypothetical protein BOTBODRAFT_31355 [Botryobasidium botryosum FD-172 SS1]|uniref:Enoyl reductase (ER) domain-containing protein n=1 Tax=Botryobasidium botryosum (strain FD-172 SS1) TaxID=930990 RepID=A0A067MVM6_BOTB1|nr:hypothetical protein BOTBODRAFT_31355 [Botryobasidium botryosum FD-172 SS1]
MAPTLPETVTRVFLAERPGAGPIKDDTFAVERVPLPQPASDDEVLVRVDYVSLDPAMRGWLNDTRSYIAPVKIGETMRAQGLGTVVKGNKTFQVGDQVSGGLGWAEYAVLKEKALTKITPPEGSTALDYLGPLGMPGMTAYIGLLEVSGINAGETLLVSGAAGAVGSIVCQIGKLKGAKVVALAGADEKCRWLEEELGVDRALNYKSPNFRKEFKDAVGYLDVFFDNVGGDILDLALTRLNKNARIALCGAISDYNVKEKKGMQNYLNLISQRAKIEGFVVLDYTARFPEFAAEVAQWIKEGRVKRKFHIEEGVERCPEYLQLLFNGGNTGKLVVKVSKETSRL